VTVQNKRPDFSDLFDRAAAACAEAQRLVGLSARTVSHTRSSRSDSSQLRRTAVLMRDAWAEAEAVHSVLRNEVERVARTLREAGVDDRAAVATVRAHIRFVLYDGGLAEQDAEPVVARASLWVEQIYAAA
jgi:DNA-directed RNA polymerase sigma subunit (sigma70/sigma32)